jgi:hypothetical protein
VYGIAVVLGVCVLLARSTTISLPWNVNATVLKAALEALDNIDTVLVTRNTTTVGIHGYANAWRFFSLLQLMQCRDCGWQL